MVDIELFDIGIFGWYIWCNMEKLFVLLFEIYVYIYKEFYDCENRNRIMIGGFL